MRIAEAGEKAEEQSAEKPKSVSVVGVLPEEEEGGACSSCCARTRKGTWGKARINKGSGLGGSITKEDVADASEKGKKTEDQFGAMERMPLKGLRRTIAKNLITAQKTTASVTGMDEADITELWNLREKEKKPIQQEKGMHLTFMPFFIKAVYHALLEHPLLNASIDDEREEIIIKKIL